jgi:alpha-ketoglutarate-dependent taurine dioxygenase
LTARANQLWHTDSSFKTTPALASVLSARIVPRHGGDMELTSTRPTWTRLSPAMRSRFRDAVVTHAYAFPIRSKTETPNTDNVRGLSNKYWTLYVRVILD